MAGHSPIRPTGDATVAFSSAQHITHTLSLPLPLPSPHLTSRLLTGSGTGSDPPSRHAAVTCTTLRSLTSLRPPRPTLYVFQLPTGPLAPVPYSRRSQDVGPPGRQSLPWDFVSVFFSPLAPSRQIRLTHLASDLACDCWCKAAVLCWCPTEPRTDELHRLERTDHLAWGRPVHLARD
jgi:hypothetical protein